MFPHTPHPELQIRHSQNNMNTLLWFQRDLRLHHNPSLDWALSQSKPVIAVYIHSPQEDAPWSEGAASRWWLQQSLSSLKKDLLELNINLHCIKGNSVEKINSWVNKHNIDSVVWTNRVEPNRVKCENTIEAQLNKQNITVKRFTPGLLPSPSKFLTLSNETAYRVFTPFYRRLRAELNFSDYYPKSSQHIKNTISKEEIKLKDKYLISNLDLLDTHNWHSKLNKYWTHGEGSAHKMLDHFIEDKILNYIPDRDYPATDATSSLSAHLHFGEISLQQVLSALIPLIQGNSINHSVAAEGFLRQLIWREYAQYIMYHFPHTALKPMNEKYKPNFWKDDKEMLQKWQQGNTGITLVDAGMKQLWETGSMHNRVRMLVASLLTKNMGINWQHGANWFWDTLVDADLANNSMGWQWVAGCGVDAAPYFRIFNPDTQSKKFDKNNAYSNYWLQPDRLINDEIIDLGSSRKEALVRYKTQIKN